MSRALTPGMARLFARAMRGERAVGHKPRNTSENVSLLGALSLDGMIAIMSVKGSVDTDVVLTYLRAVLLPQLWPGAIVVMDNLKVPECLRRAGCYRSGWGQGDILTTLLSRLVTD